MKNQPAEKRVSTRGNEPSPDEVAAYLEAHPEFFEERDDLLLQLTIPHARGTSISLVERQVALLRERNDAISKELGKLLDAARENDETFAKCRRLLLSLLEAKDGAQLLNHLENSLKDQFACEQYRLIIFGDAERRLNDWALMRPRSDLKKQIPGLISSHKPVLGVLRESETEYLFGPDAKKIGSTGIFPIRRSRDIALLAIASTGEGHFQSGMGTLFTDFITDALARLLPRFTYD